MLGGATAGVFSTNFYTMAADIGVIAQRNIDENRRLLAEADLYAEGDQRRNDILIRAKDLLDVIDFQVTLGSDDRETAILLTTTGAVALLTGGTLLLVRRRKYPPQQAAPAGEGNVHIAEKNPAAS
jgi:hypothetical protein